KPVKQTPDAQSPIWVQLDPAAAAAGATATMTPTLESLMLSVPVRAPDAPAAERVFHEDIMASRPVNLMSQACVVPVGTVNGSVVEVVGLSVVPMYKSSVFGTVVVTDGMVMFVLAVEFACEAATLIGPEFNAPARS